jgi:tripartite-type tricarboxylate transporter receptor subunit TctC
MAEKRHPLLPDVSTMPEQGYKDFVLGNWVGIVMPAGTPKPIIDKMYNEVARLMKLPEVAEKVVQQGFDPAIATPEEFGKRIKNETARFAKAVKESGARVD